MEHIRYKKETEVVTFQGKEITLENLSPVCAAGIMRACRAGGAVGYSWRGHFGDHLEQHMHER